MNRLTLRYMFILFSLASSMTTYANSVRIAFFDFDSIPGIEKHNVLRKAMSGMLISDI